MTGFAAILGFALGVVLGGAVMWLRLRRAGTQPTKDVAEWAVSHLPQTPNPGEQVQSAEPMVMQDPQLLEEVAELRVALDRAQTQLAEKSAEVVALGADLDAVMSEALVAPHRYYPSYEASSDTPAKQPAPTPPPPVADAHPPALLDQARQGGADPLSLLAGCATPSEAALHQLGVFHFDQVAAWTESDQRWIHAKLGSKVPLDVISLWVTQAQGRMDQRHELID
ncbi:MAG: hypothetical protein AAFR93_16145 [Pseudomonadota bacterium]